MRHLIIFLSIALLGNAGAATFGSYAYVINPDNVSVTITGYPTTATGAIEIPATIDGRSVISIRYYAFQWCTGLTSITIPDSVISIGDEAFNDCSSLTSITIPDSVTSIGDDAFAGCSSLTSITIGNSVTSIGDFAFLGCSSLTSIIIPDSVTSIGISAFRGCTSLTSVTIGNSVISIGQAAFSYCDSLTSITIPDSVISIGDYAFMRSSSLTSITIPDSVTSIGYSAFWSATGLTSIVVAADNPNYSSMGPLLLNKNGTVLIACPSASDTFIIPNSVTSIGGAAFVGCTSLTSVTIGNSVISIGQTAFSYCDSLTSVTIGNSVTSIGSIAFWECTNLASIRLQSMAAPTIGSGAFDQISNAAIIYYPLGATGYAASYDGVPTEEGPPPVSESPALEIGDFYESSAGVSVVVSAIPTAGYPTNFSYQWYFNGFTIPSTLGGTASSLTLDGSSDSNGTWRVVVTNDAGSTEASFEYRVFADSDSDGLSDYRESNITNTNPALADTDSDGLNDFVEVNTTLTDPNDSDSDDDTLLDGAEVNTYGSDPKDTDSDDDGLLDGAEVNTYSTSPIDADSDNDTLTDSQEVLTYFTNPNLADSDSDGLSDAAELNTYFSLPNTSDTDGDGLTDGDEVNTHNSSPIDSDSDDDTILDGIEVRHATFGFDPAVDSSTRLAALIALVEEFPGVSTDAQNNSLSLGGISLTPGGGNSLSVDFIIEESEDLSSWTTVDTVSHSLDTSDTKKFIRVRKP